MAEIIFGGGPSTVWHFLNSALKNHGQNLAQIDAESETMVTYSELILMTERICELFEACKIPKGSILLIKCSNSLLLAPLILGTWKADLACALINPECKEAELVNMKNITKSIVLIEDRPVRVTIADEPMPIVTSKLRDIIENRGMCEIEELDVVIFLDSCKSNLSGRATLVLSSSGSTGLPKGVALSHKNIISALLESHTFVKEGELALSVLPQSHAFGLILMLMCLREGATLVMLNKFNVKTYLKTADLYKAETLFMVPPLLQIIGNHLEEAAVSLSSVRAIWTGASTIRFDLQKKVSEALAHKPKMYHSYGMTETTFTVFSGVSREDKPGSCGTVSSFFDCVIVDPVTKKCLPINEDGELYVRSSSIMLGYLENSEATDEALTQDGWLRTGDLGHFDSDHYFFVVDRIKEMIKCNSYQVSPNELEQVVIGLPGVEDVTVVGMPHDFSGEIPVALVVKELNSSITEEFIKDHVSRTLSSYKQIRSVVFVEHLPKSPSGKPMRRQALAMIYPPRKQVTQDGMFTPQKKSTGEDPDSPPEWQFATPA